MFVETDVRPQGEVAPAKVMKLSEVVRECGYGNSMNPYDCVLVRAYKRIAGHSAVDRVMYGRNEGNYRYWTAKLFDVPERIAAGAERLCIAEHAPEKIADWLEAQGY